MYSYDQKDQVVREYKNYQALSPPCNNIIGIVDYGIISEQWFMEINYI